MCFPHGSASTWGHPQGDFEQRSTVMANSVIDMRVYSQNTTFSVRSLKVWTNK